MFLVVMYPFAVQYKIIHTKSRNDIHLKNAKPFSFLCQNDTAINRVVFEINVLGKLGESRARLLKVEAVESVAQLVARGLQRENSATVSLLQTTRKPTPHTSSLHSPRLASPTRR